MPIALDVNISSFDAKKARKGCYSKLKQTFTDFKHYYEAHNYFYSIKEMEKIEKHIKKLEKLL